MILVIADDFSGAAEIAEIGFCHGLKARVQTEFFPDSGADLVVLDIDSRSCSPLQAAQRVQEVIRKIKTAAAKIDWIYKKIDSVLRGPVAAELNALLNAAEARRVLLIPANPSRGRVIRQGRYFIDGQPLDKTDFANDPEYPAFSSKVLELLGWSSPDAGFLNIGQNLPDAGIWIGQGENSEDIQSWAGCLDPRTIPAGAGDFFTAILQSKGFYPDASAVQQILQIRQPALFVLGSGSAYSRQTFREAQRMGQAVCRMPDDIFNSANVTDRLVCRWSDEMAAAFETNDCVIVAIDRPVVSDAGFARNLSAVMSAAVQQVLARIAVRDFYIEGGATASAIVRRLGWKQFCISGRFAAGVVQMQVAEKEWYLTVKPGSYPWPERIRNGFLKGISRAN